MAAGKTIIAGNKLAVIEVILMHEVISITEKDMLMQCNSIMYIYMYMYMYIGRLHARFLAILTNIHIHSTCTY